MTELKSPRTGDSIFVEDHASGLKIMIYPKPGYRSAYAVFGTRYGSVNTRFKADGELVSVPDGIAHFLVPPLTLSPPSTRPVICFPVRKTLRNPLKSCWIWSSPPILPSRPSKRSKESSARKSGCTTILRIGG